MKVEPRVLQTEGAVCRQGLGVVTDLMTVGARIIPDFEKGNAEMRHNSEVLKMQEVEIIRGES